MRNGNGQAAVATFYECVQCGHELSEWSYTNQRHLCGPCWRRSLQEEWFRALTEDVIRSCDERVLPSAIRAIEAVLMPVL